MKTAQNALITVGCLFSLVFLAACGSEETSTNQQVPDGTSADTVILQPNPATLPPAYVQPNVPAYPVQPDQNTQPDPNLNADLQRQRAINRQLDDQNHYQNTYDYQRKSIQQTQDYLNHSKAKSFDPAGAP